MTRISSIKAAALCGACTILLSAAAASARDFNIPSGDLESALDSYTAQTGVALIVSNEAIHGIRTKGVQGDLSADDALTRLLSGTGFTTRRTPAGAVGIVRTQTQSEADVSLLQLAQAAPSQRASVETVTVTSSKLGGADVQSIPIAITALSQEQLTSTQTAGGPDLVKQVPNLTFTKTNFSGYSIQIRGIGTQAISVTTDPAVAVAFNDIPFIRNHFFEQEFYDVSQVEVLRGPQGTLYGRNATAGVVNVISAKPTDHYEAMASVDVGNYNNRRLEAMLNVPIVGDQLDLRMAGEWTKRDGYTYDTTLQQPVDGRDLWSGRVSLLLHPIESVTATLVWEHFQENDDRLRSAKTLCKTDPGVTSVNGPAGLVSGIDISGQAWTSQGCLPVSLYSPDAYQAPNAGSLPYIAGGEYLFGTMPAGFDPYGGIQQSRSLRVIGSFLKPRYTAKNDTLEFNIDYQLTSALKLSSQTGYNKDNLYSTEDFSRFDTVPGAFVVGDGYFGFLNPVGTDGQYCDPQLGCSDRVLGEDVSQEHAQQFYQELRLASDFAGPFNFSVGANYMHYQTLEDYFVFFNALSLFVENWNGLPLPSNYSTTHFAFDGAQANACGPVQATADMDFSSAFFGLGCAYVDPNPLSQIDGQGHNYFRSNNPYHLNSWAGFGEAYYQVSPDVKLTAGLRWTDDSKHFDEIPSWTAVLGKGYPVTSVLDQEWKQWTGRFNATWTPKISFTDQSMFYASYSRGYKAGGANPPGVIPILFFGTQIESPSNYTHPLTFKPEFVNAFETGSKNTLLDGSLVLNGDVFYYDYKGYQISQIVDRTSVNLNFDATVEGAELQSTWEPLPGLKLSFSGGYEKTRIANGSQAIDLMDRTAGHSDWMIVKPFITQTSNCILPTDVVNEILSVTRPYRGGNNSTSGATALGNYFFFGDGPAILSNACVFAYSDHFDPVTRSTYVANPTTDYGGTAITNGYAGFDPTTAPNNGEGFAKDIGGNELPNAPHYTVSLAGDYTMPVSGDWAATFHTDFYWQSQSWARVENDQPYDKLRGYTNVNLALIFTNQDGWQAMAYAKNVFDTTAITGAFLNSDDTGLTTNVFTTDPRLFGIRITKNW